LPGLRLATESLNRSPLPCKVGGFMAILKRYLIPTVVIDSGSKLIRETSEELVKGLNTYSEIAKRIFYFVRDEIKYTWEIPPYSHEYYVASKILMDGKGYCVQKAVLLVALARSLGIPSRLRFADIRNHKLPKDIEEKRRTNLFIYHGYAELFITGKWIKVTPLFDPEVHDKKGMPLVEFNGKDHAMLPRFDEKGNPWFEYVRDHGHYDDLPLEEIYKARAKAGEIHLFS